ncbi:hypothetical protein MRBBS_3318 [Marinobacter sp. BSs20148]|nr:hypothetical protein MRBBS_3318 [Marinobacter sp. BSs20148]
MRLADRKLLLELTGIVVFLLQFIEIFWLTLKKSGKIGINFDSLRNNDVFTPSRQVTPDQGRTLLTLCDFVCNPEPSTFHFE